MRVVLIVLSCVVFARCAAGQAEIEQSAKALFDAANAERSSRGIPRLKWDASLAEAARAHAERMAEQNTLSHQFPGEADVPTRERQAGARISAAAENVALGPSVESIQTGWMHSPPHRHNLLDPQLDSIGIAVVPRGGTLFAVEDFSRALAALSLEGQEKRVGATIQAAGLKVRQDNSDARKACEDGHTDRTYPGFIERFSTTNLDALPDALERAVHSGKYAAAEIGACAKPSTDGLSEYHIAVLLYE
jgi:hypothetical protein